MKKGDKEQGVKYFEMDSLLFLECRFQPLSQGSPLPVLTERESEKGFLYSEGRTGLFSPMRDYLFLFFLNPEFNKLFFVFRDQMVVRAPRKT